MASRRIGTQSNLTLGQTYDLDLLSFGTQPFPVGVITFDFGNTPRRTSGIQKCAQMYLKCLLTPTGSDILHPGYGTQLVPNFVGSNRPFTSSSGALPHVQQFVDDATLQVQALTSNSTPSGALQSVSVLSCIISVDILNVSLYLLTKAGVGAQIAIPFPQLTMQTA